jgi:hypothetical protein
MSPHRLPTIAFLATLASHTPGCSEDSPEKTGITHCRSDCNYVSTPQNVAYQITSEDLLAAALGTWTGRYPGNWEIPRADNEEAIVVPSFDVTVVLSRSESSEQDASATFAYYDLDFIDTTCSEESKQATMTVATELCPPLVYVKDAVDIAVTIGGTQRQGFSLAFYGSSLQTVPSVGGGQAGLILVGTTSDPYWSGDVWYLVNVYLDPSSGTIWIDANAQNWADLSDLAPIASSHRP